MYARIRHDREFWTKCDTAVLVENSRYDDPCWKFGGSGTYPATIEHLSKPSGGDNGVKLTKEWWEDTRNRNTPEGFEAACRVNGGWANYARPWNKEHWGMGEIISPDTTIYPVVEPITTTGNYVKVLERRNGASRIETLDPTKPPPKDINHISHPWLFVNVTNINAGGRIQEGIYNTRLKKTYPVIVPLLAKEEAWIRDDKLEFGVELPEEQMITRAHGVDISRWQDPYRDDGIDEGFPLDFVIQKAADGITNYTTSTALSWWKPQYESIKHLGIKGFYHYMQTEMQGEPQGDVCADIADSGLYDFAVVDYERYDNIIDVITAGELEDFVNAFRASTNMKLILYTNGWIYSFLQQTLGQEWLDQIDLWIAGGIYYNQPRTAPLPDSIPFPNPKAVMWQYSADGNGLADELDFGTYEAGSIDLNLFKGTVTDMLAWIGHTSPEPPQDKAEAILNDLEGIIAKYR